MGVNQNEMSNTARHAPHFGIPPKKHAFIIYFGTDISKIAIDNLGASGKSVGWKKQRSRQGVRNKAKCCHKMF
jgi:hypothetical protein